MEFIDVSETAVQTGFAIYGCVVIIEKNTWLRYVEWTDQDNENQCYQEMDARLWDLVNVGGTTLELNPNSIFIENNIAFNIYCIPRDGVSDEASKINFDIYQVDIGDTKGLMIIEGKAVSNANDDDW